MLKNFWVIVIIFTLTFAAVANDASKLFNEGKNLFEQKKYQEAANKFVKASLADKKHVKSRIALAKSYMAMNKFQKAVAPLKEIINIEPNNETALELLIQTYYNLKNYTEVVNYGKKYKQIAKNPTNTAYYLLGNSYYNLKSWAQSLNAYKKAVSLDGKDYKSLYKIGKINYMAKKYPKALEYFEKSGKINSNYIYTFYYKGLAYYKQKNYSEAAKAFEQTTKIKPNFTKGYYFLMITNIKRENYQDTVKYGTQLLKYQKNAKNYYYIGIAYDKLNQPKTAYNYFNKGAAYSGKFAERCAKYAKYLKSSKLK
ncbi:MAG TPA: tetratricopeptide repeat protein [Candidatus Mcinerneyibacterium sp.]|nr:tetratricopeptide repeat protein [Candidatus Mcinerneyibacterium sp.]